MRPLEEIKADPRLWAFGVKGHGAIVHAYIDFTHRGQHELQAKHEAQAAILRQAIEIMLEPETRKTLEHNLAGRVIHDEETGNSLTLCPWVAPDSPVHSWPVIQAFLSVVQDHAQWLEHPHNINFKERKDRNFLTFLGRHWRRYGMTEKPAIKAMRKIHDIVMGEESSQEESDLAKAFAAGWEVSEKNR